MWSDVTELSFTNCVPGPLLHSQIRHDFYSGQFGSEPRPRPPFLRTIHLSPELKINSVYLYPHTTEAVSCNLPHTQNTYNKSEPCCSCAWLFDRTWFGYFDYYAFLAYSVRIRNVGILKRWCQIIYLHLSWSSFSIYPTTPIQLSQLCDTGRGKGGLVNCGGRGSGGSSVL
jgi:hypothetical protein